MTLLRVTVVTAVTGALVSSPAMCTVTFTAARAPAGSGYNGHGLNGP